MTLWIIRILFLSMCTMAGYAVSAVRPEWTTYTWAGALIGFGFGWLMIALDEMLKGFSLRAFSATTFGLILGSVVAFLIDNSGLFENVENTTRWLIRLGLFLGFSYIGIILAMRSNKEDFSLIIPYVRFAPQNRPDNLLLLDTSVIIDGRIADLIEANFLEGVIVVPRFVLRELQQVGDSSDPVKRARGRRGLEMLNRIQRNTHNEVKIHDGDFPEEPEVDAKLVRLARNLNAKLFTNDFNLGKIAELQSVKHVNLHELARSLRVILLPGEMLNLRIVREGRDKGQGVGYLSDGTMVVVNHAQNMVGQEVSAQVQSTLQTGAGVIVFTDLKPPSPERAEIAPPAREPGHRLLHVQRRRGACRPRPTRNRAVSPRADQRNRRPHAANLFLHRHHPRPGPRGRSRGRAGTVGRRRCPCRRPAAGDLTRGTHHLPASAPANEDRVPWRDSWIPKTSRETAPKNQPANHVAGATRFRTVGNRVDCGSQQDWYAFDFDFPGKHLRWRKMNERELPTAAHCSTTDCAHGQ